MEPTIFVIRHLSMFVMVGLGAGCAHQWYRHRTPARAWSAAAFGSIAVQSLIWLALPEPNSTGRHSIVFKALVACLVAFPWFLFRFTVALEPVGRRFSRLVDVSFAVAVGAVLVLPFIPAVGVRTPLWWDIYRWSVILQWSALFGFLAIRLWRAANKQPTIARRRMRTLAAAIVLMNLSVLLPQTPEGAVSELALGRAVLSLAVGLLLFVGLSTPEWLLHTWRKSDYGRLRGVMGEVLRAESLEALGNVILPPCTDILGARGAALIDEAGEIVVEHGQTGDSRDRFVHSVQLSNGEVRFWMSPYAPFFGKGELELIQSHGLFIDIAAQRCRLSDVRRESAREMRFQASHDVLTGLPNRAYLVDQMKIHLSSLRKRPGAMCVQFLDLDRFKLVNDGINHSAGDALLVGVAARLVASLRETDLVARFGGDEFVVVSVVEDEAEALHLAGRIAGGLAAPFMLSGREIRVTASIGLVVVRDGNTDLDSILRDADTAMYHAKAQGRSRIVLFDEEVRGDSQDRLELERGLRAAVSNGTLSLHYQPTVRLADEKSIGVEALFRWNHPRLGLVHPGSVIALAEESDLIGAVGWWVLKEACRQGQEWLEEFPELPDFKIWVNLSPAQFVHRNVNEDVRRALEESGLPPGNLGLEITESVFMENTDRAAQTFRELRAIGVSIAIDDFGTGYSSLRSMKHFPADVLKIDGSFIAGVDDDLHDQAIVSACLTMAGALGLTVVAEAVETMAQADKLLEMGCQVAQGFYYSPALPPGQLSRFLKNEIAKGKSASPIPLFQAAKAS